MTLVLGMMGGRRWCWGLGIRFDHFFRNDIAPFGAEKVFLVKELKLIIWRRLVPLRALRVRVLILGWLLLDRQRL